MTTPYVTGTVSVTAGSAIVTGSGTGWQTAGLVAGQFGLDSANGNPIPVLSVDSDTQITLAKPWRGTTASAQAYWITYDTQPGQQTVLNAQRLAEYIARLDKPALAALASLTPAADKLPYFGANGAGALADFKALARSLLALNGAANKLPYMDAASTYATTDLSAFVRTLLDDVDAAAFYATLGQVPNTQVRNDLTPDKAFRRGNILGTVSQTSGVPTGAIIERGSNANGEYVRFADGTQICWGASPQLAYGGVSGSFHFSAVFTVTWAASFITSPVVSTGVLSGAPSSAFGARTTAISTTLVSGRIYGPQSWTGNDPVLEAVAIGRWF